jgi:hypothetical protein
LALFLLLGAYVPKECLKTVFIGVDLDSDEIAKRQLSQIAAIG